MKALSVKHPWADLIALGVKDIENRTWKTSYRGRIYIHVSQKSAGRLCDLLNRSQFDALRSHRGHKGTRYAASAIIGEVDIVDCVINHQSVWAEQTEGAIRYSDGSVFVPDGIKPIYNWVLANPVLYDEPIWNVKGKLSLWEFNTAG